MLRLRSSDRKIFKVDLEAVASQSLLVRDMVDSSLGDLGTGNSNKPFFLSVPEVSGRVLAKVLDYTIYHGTRLRAITAAANGNESSGFNEENTATTAAITAEADSDTELIAVDVAAEENIAGAAEVPAEEINSPVADCNAPDDVVAGAGSSDSPAPAPARRTPEDADKQWDLQFLNSLSSEKTLFDVMMAAHYLNIPGLQHLTCVRAGERMRGMTPERARTLFNLPSDFTPEEEAAIRHQNEWAFLRK
ncbi:hypothetical protein L7F22_032083 [Adiantum nelumboides]|nr:hypothetical protein [Adiantum nelumboides]